MGVRRQIYLEDADDRLLEEESRSTGLSVSELIRRAIQERYVPGRRLTWNEFFATPVRANSAASERFTYDRLLDGDFDNLLDDQSGENGG